MQKIVTLLIFVLLAASCKTPEARRPVAKSSGSFINESIQRNKQLIAKEEAQIQQIISSDTSNTYISSKNGFWYYYNQKDTLSSVTPQFGDIVTFNYSLKELDGEVIYTKKDLDTVTYVIDKQELFLGLREGLKLMKAGETITFLFPSYQAYGYYGDEDKIGTNIPLLSEVTLYTIEKPLKTEN